MKFDEWRRLPASVRFRIAEERDLRDWIQLPVAVRNQRVREYAQLEHDPEQRYPEFTKNATDTHAKRRAKRLVKQSA